MTARARSTFSSARRDTADRPGRPAVLLAVVVLLTVSVDIRFGGPLTQLDHQVSAQMTSWALRERTWPRRALTVGVWFGQRGVVITGTVLLLGGLSWRYRTTEPIIRLAVALVGLVVFVYAFKLGLARNAPIQDAQGDPARTGTSFPSGHAANAVLLWGLAWWSVRRWPVPALLSGAIRCARWVAPVAVTVAMTLLNYHWLTDFVGGAALGVLVLGATLLPVWSRPAAVVDDRCLGRPVHR